MALQYHLNPLALAAAIAVIAMASGCENPSSLNEDSANVKHITQSDFGNEVTRCALPVAVEFYSSASAPCREEVPLVDQIAGNYSGKIKFVKVNIDESPGLAQNYEVQSVPLLILFKDGKLADHLEGLQTETNLTARLNALVAK